MRSEQNAIAEPIAGRPSPENGLSRQALAEQLRGWESIVSRSPDAVCISDDDGLIEYVNAAFERLFGHAAADILGQSLGRLDFENPPSPLTEDRPANPGPGSFPHNGCDHPGNMLLISAGLPGFEHQVSIQQTRAQGSWSGEVLVRSGDGSPIPVRLSMICRGGGCGQSGGQVSTLVDISDTKRRECQLETLRTVAEDLSTRLDLDNLVEHALAAVITLTDTDFAALAVPSADGGSLFYRWHTPAADPSQAPLLEQPFPSADSAAGSVLHDGREVCLQDCRLVNGVSDPLRHIGAQSALAYPINHEGKDPAVLCIANLERSCKFSAEATQLLATIARQIGVAMDRDRLIRDARASDRQLDEIIHRNPDAILITDDDGIVRFTNPAAQRLLDRNERELEGFRLGITSQTDAGELDVHRPNGDSVPVELHAMETTWEGSRAHVLTLRDLTDRRQAENERRASAERIHRALVQTIEAISRTVETRDPYTAGHQRRVAAIGREIARALGLDQETVDAIYMGGMIHDIGKLYIPAEILNRPGTLNDVEMLLIKTHCSVGRDIIGGIEFPWPLSKMIHQHHERIDGSGYPQGLRGEKILQEARILAVADVVDAMSSRRPYREPLGLDAALAEIENGKGTRFDHAATEACIHLFRQGTLRLEDLEAH